MAGGVSTVSLVAAAAHAGAFGFLAGGYKTADALAAEIRELRAVTRAFGVNLFVPEHARPATERTPRVAPAEFEAYAATLAGEAQAHGVTLDHVPVSDDEDWDAKIAMLTANPVPVVSLTFGLPNLRDIAALRRAGTRVLATVTTAAEAAAAAGAGVDGLVVQGPAAGGHSATWDPHRRIPVETGAADTLALLRTVRSETTLPVIAAGGVDGSTAVRELLRAGAAAVAVGTLLLRTDEAGTTPTHREALSEPGRFTTVTRAFTGRPARALRNGFIARHEAQAITAYPEVHHLTRALRGRAAAAGDADRLHLWAGTGFRAARTEPVAETLKRLTP